jgi:cytochrome c-type biogenesis protein CcmH
MLVVLVVALAIGATGDRAPSSEADHVRAIASSVRCPTCRGLSAAESDANAAHAVREEIRDRIRAGESDGEIRAFLVSRYGKDILLKPEGTGIAGLVWAIPVAALLVALAGVALAFRRWQRLRGGEPTAEDRALVEAALDAP